MSWSDLQCHKIYNQIGHPTIKVSIETENGEYTSSPDSGPCPYSEDRVDAISSWISNKFTVSLKMKGYLTTEQRKIDIYLQTFDDPKDPLKSLVLLGVSMAFCKAGAGQRQVPLYKYISQLAGTVVSRYTLPIPALTLINGGKYSKNDLAIQEFLVIPTGDATSISDVMDMGSMIFTKLGHRVESYAGTDSTEKGEHGGYLTQKCNDRIALALIHETLHELGYTQKFGIGLDVIASEFYSGGMYDFNFKGTKKSSLLTGEQLSALYLQWEKEFNLISIEDPFHPDDAKNWISLTSESLCCPLATVGDELVTTNSEKIRNAGRNKLCTSILVKFKTTTISEVMDAHTSALENGMDTIVSHRLGGSEDTFLTDFAVGIGAKQIKAGAPFGPHFLPKYERLVQIEKELEAIENLKQKRQESTCLV